MTPTVRLLTFRNMLKAVAYIRWSTEKQGDNSNGRQMDAIERWAARFGAEIIAVKRDPETSRTTGGEERPGLTEAMNMVSSGQAQILVAETISRFAGDAAILHAIEKRLGKKGKLATASDSGDDDLDDDRHQFEALMSRFEIKQIRKRTKGALAVKKMRGEAYTTPPYGKHLRADGLHTERDGRPKCAGTGCSGCKFMEDDPAEQQLISRARELAETMCTFAVAKRLADEGYVGRMGKQLSHVQVGRILERVRQEAA